MESLNNIEDAKIVRFKFINILNYKATTKYKGVYAPLITMRLTNLLDTTDPKCKIACFCHTIDHSFDDGLIRGDYVYYNYGIHTDNESDIFMKCLSDNNRTLEQVIEALNKVKEIKKDIELKES